jgi:hypothetical protein
MTPVRTTDDECIVIEFEPAEASMLSDLALQISELVGGASDDSAVERLFPPAYRDDAAAAAEFERFERAGLTDAKVEAARSVHAQTSIAGLDGGESVSVELGRDDVWPWLTHLTDVRLVLADRLGIADADIEDDPASRPDDETLTLIPLYDWLGWLQGCIVAALESFEG